MKPDVKRARLVRLLLCSAALSLVPSCAIVLGVDGDYHEVDELDPAGGSAGSAAGEGGSGGPGGSGGTDAGGNGGSGASGATGGFSGASCETLGKQCLAAPPADWAGPVALLKGATAPDCGGDFPTSAIAAILRDDLDPGVGSCVCSCTANPATCGAASLQEHGASSTCPVGASIQPISHGVCASFSPIVNAKFTAEPASLPAGACTPEQTKQMPAPSWGVSARACAPTGTGSCGDGRTCVPPTPSDGQLCIHRTGDRSCPAGYPEKTVLHDGYVDDRDCAPCSCGNPTGSCGGSVTLYSGANCASSVGSGGLNACLGAFPSVRSARLTATVSGVTCPPSPGVLTGSVEPQNPVTFCCSP